MKKIKNAIRNIAFGLLVTYMCNSGFCIYKAEQCLDKTMETPAYQEYSKIDDKINYCKRALEDYHPYLSKDGKKYLEQKVESLVEQEGKLKEELKPYYKEIQKWESRMINPLNYLR